MSNLSVEIKQNTADIHRIVETKPLMRLLMKCQLSLETYLLFLQQLHLIYNALEQQLTKSKDNSIIELVYFPKQLHRTASLKDDLHFFGQEPCTNGLPTTEKIVRRIQFLSEYKPELLIAWSYIRYLGDLSGGQFLSKKVIQSYQLGEHGYSFYNFDSIPANEMGVFKTMYRERMDQIPEKYHAGIAQETKYAFDLHAELFDEIMMPVKQSSSILLVGLLCALVIFMSIRFHFSL
jgi:heme oxygenase